MIPRLHHQSSGGLCYSRHAQARELPSGRFIGASTRYSVSFAAAQPLHHVTAQYRCFVHISAHPRTCTNSVSVARRESPTAGFDPLGVKQDKHTPTLHTFYIQRTRSRSTSGPAFCNQYVTHFRATYYLCGGIYTKCCYFSSFISSIKSEISTPKTFAIFRRVLYDTSL